MITILRQLVACNIWVANLKAKVTAWPCSKIVCCPILCYYVSPHEMGRHIVFSSVVCLSVRMSVCPSVRLSVRHTFVSALYLLNPWWDLQITLHKCQVWLDNVQCLGLTKVSWRSRSQSKIKHCMTVFRARSISLEPLVGFTTSFAQMSNMMRRCAVLMFDQGRFKVKVTI